MVMRYAGVVPQILNTVVEALKGNEQYSRQALESRTSSPPSTLRYGRKH
jgi:hypothetical protein